MNDLHASNDLELKKQQQTYENMLQFAQQAEQDGNEAKAATFYTMAGSDAAASYDNEEALDCFGRALTLTGEAALDERFALLLSRERIYGLTGATDKQANDLASLEMIANFINDDSYRAEVAARQAAWREATGDLAGAVTVASMATRLAQLTNLPRAEAMARLAWGRALIRQGHYRPAQSQLDQASLLADKTGDKSLIAGIDRFQGVLAQDRAQTLLAQLAYQRALLIYEELGDRQGQLHIHSNLAQILQARGQLAQARLHWEENLDLFRELGDAEGGLRTLVNLAASSCDVGMYEEAQQYAQEALKEAQQSRNAIGECFAHLNLGLVAHYQGRNETSAAENRAAYHVAEQLGSARLQAHALSVLAHALVELGQVSEAENAYWEAVAIWHQLELPNMIAESKAGLARAALQKDELDMAAKLVESIWTQAEIDPDFEGAELPVRIYLTCQQVWQKIGDPRASEALSKGLKIVAQQSDGLNDEAARHSLRHNVPAHRDILAL